MTCDTHRQSDVMCVLPVRLMSSDGVWEEQSRHGHMGSVCSELSVQWLVGHVDSVWGEGYGHMGLSVRAVGRLARQRVGHSMCEAAQRTRREQADRQGCAAWL